MEPQLSDEVEVVKLMQAIRWTCSASAPRKVLLAGDLSMRTSDGLAKYYEPGTIQCPEKTEEWLQMLYHAVESSSWVAWAQEKKGKDK